MSAITKLRKWGGVEPTEVEVSVAQNLHALETSDANDKSLVGLYVVKAKEIEVPEIGSSVVVVFVPRKQLKSWQRVYNRVCPDLEKKLSKQVFFIADRKIMKKPSSEKIKRPRVRTLSAVHEAALEDICYPDDIVGKRTRVAINGKRLIKVFLTPKDKDTTVTRLASLRAVYKKLTGKEASFEFPNFFC